MVKTLSIKYTKVPIIIYVLCIYSFEKK